MTKTDKKYFEKLAHDLVNGIVRAATCEKGFNDYDDFQARQKELADLHHKSLDHDIHLYERGLVTREECFKLMMEYYTVSV